MHLKDRHPPSYIVLQDRCRLQKDSKYGSRETENKREKQNKKGIIISTHRINNARGGKEIKEGRTSNSLSAP